MSTDLVHATCKSSLSMDCFCIFCLKKQPWVSALCFNYSQEPPKTHLFNDIWSIAGNICIFGGNFWVLITYFLTFRSVVVIWKDCCTLLISKKLAQHKCETPRIVYWLSKMYRRTFCRECMYVCMYVCMFLFPIGCLQAMILNKIIKGNFSFWDWTLFKKIWSKSFMKNIHCNQKRRGYTNFSSGNDRCLKSLHILFIWTHFRQTNSLSPRSPCMW